MPPANAIHWSADYQLGCLMQWFSPALLTMKIHSWQRPTESSHTRERYRDRRKWRHHCRAKIGDELHTRSLCQKFAQLAMTLHFPLPKTRTFNFVSPFTLPVSPFTEMSPLCRWNSQWVHTIRFFFHRKVFALFVRTFSNGASRATSDRNPRQTTKSCPVIYCSSHRKNESN